MEIINKMRPSKNIYYGRTKRKTSTEKTKRQCYFF